MTGKAAPLHHALEIQDGLPTGKTLCGLDALKKNVLTKNEPTCSTCLFVRDDTECAAALKAPVSHVSLNERQKKFIAHPEVMTNTMKAALDCGFTEKFAREKAHLLRDRMWPLIERYTRQAIVRSGVTPDKVIQELARIGFANLTDFFAYDPNGILYLEDPDKWPPELAAAVKEIETEVVQMADGTTRRVVTSVKLHDKRGPLQDLAKIMGILKEKGDAPNSAPPAVPLDLLDTEDLEQLENIMLKAVQKTRSTRADKDAIEGEKTQGRALVKKR